MSSPTAKVRPFDPRTDLHRIIAFHLDLVEINFPARGLVDGLEYDNALREEAFGPDGAFKKAITSADPRTNGIFVWEEKDRLVGYLWLKLSYDTLLNTTIGTLNEIYVVPERRGTGLGKAIMAFAQNWFKVHNVRIQRLHVTAANERAVRLYDKFGYSVTRYEMERIEDNDRSTNR